MTAFAAIIGTLATAALFAAFVVIATFLGLIAWHIVVAAMIAALVGFTVALIAGVAVMVLSIAERLRASRRDPYAVSFGDVPKVPHGR